MAHVVESFLLVDNNIIMRTVAADDPVMQAARSSGLAFTWFFWNKF